MSEVQIEKPSGRELELLSLVSQGLSNREIALQMNISPNTVKVHLRNIFAKINARSRTEATMIAVQNGWVEVTLPETVSEPRTPEPEQVSPSITIEVLTAPPPQSIAPWQRIYLVVTVIIVLLGFLLVRLSRPAAPSVFELEPTASPKPPIQGDGDWQSLPSLPEARSGLAVVFYNDRLYAMGGETLGEQGTVVSDQVETYDLRSPAWISGPALPVAVADVSGAALRGRLFVPGGRLADGEIGDRLQIFSPDDNAWTLGRPLPRALSAYALATYAGDLYLFGGWDGQSVITSVYRYDPQQDMWEPLASMPTPRAFFAAGTIGEHIYVVGGYDGKGELATCEVYAPDDDRWAACPSMAEPRGGIGATVIDNKLHVIGGGWVRERFLLQNEMWVPGSVDPTDGDWELVSSPVIGEWRHLGVAGDERETLYVVGGWSGQPLDAVWVSKLVYRIYLPMSSGKQ
ncbi:MAG: hypothetical protein JW934_00675 [Anaerolineae bacterium]|nr:hypothetical protein [Anaerolineae bacterium]